MTWFPKQRFGTIPIGAFQRGLSPGALSLYAALTTHCDPRGHCRLGDQALADILNTSLRTTRRRMAELVAAGVVDRQRRRQQSPITKLVPIEAPIPATVGSYTGSIPATDGSHQLSIPATDGSHVDLTDKSHHTQTSAQVLEVLPTPAAPGREEPVPDPRLTGEAVDYDDVPSLRGKSKRSADLVKLGTAAWVEERFKATVLSLGASRFNLGHFRRITKTLRDEEGLSNEEIVQIIEIWEAQDPGLRQKLRDSGANASQLFHQDVLNNGGLLRYRANRSMGAPAPGETPWAVTQSEQRALEYQEFFAAKKAASQMETQA